MTDIFETSSFASSLPTLPTRPMNKKKKRTERAERTKRIRRTNKKSQSSGDTVPLYIIRQWIDSMNGKPKTVPACSIPLLYCPKGNYSTWLYTMMTSVYRKRSDWHTLIATMWKGAHLIEPDAPLTLKHPNPFFYSRHIALHLDKLMCLNATLRMCILRCIQRRLLAKMDQRVVGETDLHTTATIPLSAMVSVYDYKTRAKYVFHTNTILKMILSSLKYCAYGIATPKAPKNPYTNLTWTYPQLMSITQQIVCNMAALHRIPPPLFLNYYNCNYVITRFAKFCEKELGVHAAIDLFQRHDDTDTQDIYSETLEDVAEETGIFISVRMHDTIIERKLPASLQAKWDTLALSLWIYTNIHVLYNDFVSYASMCEEFKTIYEETRVYINMLYKQRRPRPQATQLARTYATNVLIDATIYTDNVLEVTEENLPSLVVHL